MLILCEARMSRPVLQVYMATQQVEDSHTFSLSVGENDLYECYTGLQFFLDWFQRILGDADDFDMTKVTMWDVTVHFPINSRLSTFKVRAEDGDPAAHPKLFQGGQAIEVYPTLMPACKRMGRKKNSEPAGERDVIDQAFQEIPGVKERTAALKKWARRTALSKTKAGRQQNVPETGGQQIPESADVHYEGEEGDEGAEDRESDEDDFPDPSRRPAPWHWEDWERDIHAFDGDAFESPVDQLDAPLPSHTAARSAEPLSPEISHANASAMAASSRDSPAQAPPQGADADSRAVASAAESSAIGGERPVAARRGQRLHSHFGPFVINQLWPNEEFKGFSILCKRHKNVGDTKDNCCHADLSMETKKEQLTEEETLLRLKRWCALGYNVPQGAGARHAHMKQDIKARKCNTPLSENALEQARRSGEFTEQELNELM